MSKSSIAKLHGSSMFSFIRSAKLFSRVALLFCSSTNSAWVIQFLHILPSIKKNFSHLDRYAELSHCGFNLHLTNNNVVYLFMCLFTICISSSVKCQCMNFSHLVFEVLFYCWVWELFIYSRYQSFFGYVVCKYFLPVYSLFFSSS